MSALRVGAVFGAMAITLCLAAATTPAAADHAAGRVHIAKPAEASFDRFTSSPGSLQKSWMASHFWRMRVYSPYFDSRLSWFSNAWAYQNLYAIYPNDAIASTRPEWILKDSGGRRLYIPFQCGGGTCPQYAGDVGSPAFRSYWIDRARRAHAAGYRGIFVDDVNLAMKVSNGYGQTVAPIDPRTRTTMTLDNWQRYVAEFTEQLRAALPADFEIVHNHVYFHAGLANAYARRAIDAATHLEIERGVIDKGVVGGTGKWGFETLLAWADHAHSRGKSVIWDAQSTWGRQYQLATYFLAGNGRDAMSHPEGSNPDNWWSGYDVDLGPPLGQRYSSNGVFRRNFHNGIVLVNQPGQTTKTLSLGSEHKNLAGSTVTSVTLPAREGVVLLRPGTAGSTEKAAGRPATASSVERAGLEAGRANDSSSTTRWSSAYADNQWWRVDLGSARKIDAVELTWEFAYARTYRIQVSSDGANFTDVAAVTLGVPGRQRTTFAPVTARYVRVLCLTRGTSWGFSLWNAEVHGPPD